MGTLLVLWLRPVPAEMEPFFTGPNSFVHSVMPHGAFGAYDIPIRAAITGTVTGLASLLILTLNKRWERRTRLSDAAEYCQMLIGATAPKERNTGK